MCRSNFYETGIYSCQLEVKNTFKYNISGGTLILFLTKHLFFAIKHGILILLHIAIVIQENTVTQTISLLTVFS